MKVKKLDFVEIEYTAKIKDTDVIFDLTDEEQAKKAGIHQKGEDYGPRIICVGRNHILTALEEAIENKEEKQEFETNLTPKQGFGQKQSQLIRTIPTEQLLKQKIDPYPGLQISMMGRNGTIRSVSRGRTMVDFNHPLAGRNLSYKIKILSIVKDDKKKLNGLIRTLLGIKDAEIKEDFTIKTKKPVPKEIQVEFLKEAKETIPKISPKFV